MRAIVEVSRKDGETTKLSWFIHDAPHRRMHRAVLAKYPPVLWDAWLATGEKAQINENVELAVMFINPCGPDLDNLMVALHQALDGKTGKGPKILRDDRQIVLYNKIGIMWTGRPHP